MNKLDGKVIVDREAAERILKHLEVYSCAHLTAFRHAFIRPLEQALATDLSGWAAVPVVQTPEMLNAGKGEYQMVLATFGNQYKLDAIGEAYYAMLNASPPLPKTTGG